MRLTGNTFWLEKEDWNDFVDYEKEVDRVIGNYKMMAICTYSLDRCNATEIIDVIVNHQFALIKKNGKWGQIESSRHKEAEETAILQSMRRKKAEDTLLQAYKNLRVKSEELQTQSEKLHHAYDTLRERAGRFRRLVNQVPIPLCFVNKDGVLIYFNDRFVTTFGYTHEDVPTLKEWWQLAYPDESYRS